MKTITLTTYNRPQYLHAFLTTLAANDLSGYTLYVGIEPGSEAVADLCRGISFVPTVLQFNGERLGVSRNPFSVIERAFDAGSEYNVCLEDDLLLAPDALYLTNWFFKNYSAGCLGLNLLSYGSDPRYPTEIRKSRHFIPLGWATTRDAWERHLKVQWFSDRRGWDYSINNIIDRNPGLFVMEPVLSRANHSGRYGGTHCTPDFHDKLFKVLPLSSRRERNFYLRVE